MSTPSASLSLNEPPARMGVGSIELGQRWAQVMPEAESLYAVAPECEARKIARGNSRRAWLLETCTYLPTSITFADTPVQLVRHYYIDQELLRIDIGMVGGEAELAGMVSSLSERLGAVSASAAEAQPGIVRWQLAVDEAALRMADESLPGNESPLVMLYLRDVKAAEEARAIAGW